MIDVLAKAGGSSCPSLVDGTPLGDSSESAPASALPLILCVFLSFPALTAAFRRRGSVAGGNHQGLESAKQ